MATYSSDWYELDSGLVRRNTPIYSAVVGTDGQFGQKQLEKGPDVEKRFGVVLRFLFAHSC